LVRFAQISGDRFVDAHENTDKDFSVVSRTAQKNDTQRCVFRHITTYSIQQLSNGRYIDADYSDYAGLITSAEENSDSPLGYLNVDELLTKTFSTNLIVLSACDT
jgi:hypothetical protein